MRFLLAVITVATFATSTHAGNVRSTDCCPIGPDFDMGSCTQTGPFAGTIDPNGCSDIPGPIQLSYAAR
jgi:hypothetical protein